VDNCLGKRSGMTRTLSARHLISAYSLDPQVLLFRALQFFWKREEASQPLLALMCLYTRDSLLRLSAPFILKHPEGNVVSLESVEKFLDSKDPGRFSTATLKSTAQNLNSTWTQSGHLSGRIKKIRSRVRPTPGAVSYALLLGYLSGARGQRLFSTEYTGLLDCSPEHAMELAGVASRKGWIVFKRIGEVMEVLFPNLLTAKEGAWVHEQN